MGSRKKEKKGKSEVVAVASTRRKRNKDLKTYRVHATCMVTHEADLEIEASSEEEAMEIAEEESFDWNSLDDCAYFEVASAELVEVAA